MNDEVTTFNFQSAIANEYLNLNHCDLFEIWDFTAFPLCQVKLT